MPSKSHLSVLNWKFEHINFVFFLIILLLGYITNWFLTSKPEHFYDERMPLPETSSMSHLCLFGEIKPNRQDHPSNYKVQITDLKVW